MSLLLPQGPYQGPFINPEIPEGLFYIRYRDGVDGPFDGTTFIVDPETSIAYSSNGAGHPVFIRCVGRIGDRLRCIDGDGTPYVVELIRASQGPDSTSKPAISSAPGEIRTPDLRFRRPTLYPAELRAHAMCLALKSCRTRAPMVANQQGSTRTRGQAGRPNSDAGSGA
jgi:hypothetical protein